MRIKKILILFYLFVLLSTSCYANEITLKTSEELKENSNVNIKITINLGELEENVYFLQGQLEYDTSIFEKVGSEDIKLLNGWHDLVFNPENGMFVVEGLDTVESNLQDIMNVKMKTKDNIQNNTTTIKLKNIKEVGESQIENELEDVTLTISKPPIENFANSILPFAGSNSIITYGLLIIIGAIVVIFIRNKRNHKTK